jgi:hypothetical protein
MPMQLKASQLEYEFSDDNGYRFTVVCVRDAEYGSWSASVSMASHGYTTPETAIAVVLQSAKEFVRQAEKHTPEGPDTGKESST